MKTKILIAIILCCGLHVFGQNSNQIEVLTLGSFHFRFPNLDIKKIEKGEQIDVLDKKHQAEIEQIVKKLAKFKPTIIAIERQPDNQAETDADYEKYLLGKYVLKRDEDEQIGFRLGKLAGVKKLFCVDEWGGDFQSVSKIMDDKTNPKRQEIIDFLSKNPDSSKFFNPPLILKKQGISAQLKAFNSPEYVKRSLGDYLIGVFKYETPEDKYFGPDFVTGWWFNRNLRIFRNIQRIKAKPTDKIFVIFGAGHLNLLNPFFDSSPEYKLMNTNDYLK
ncbi:MAG: DUF5694 domain-containing protein [Pyrinomonadaceae bacterium]